MAERLKFRSDAAIIGRLGAELVAKQETALVELIKNAFDADATVARVKFVGAWPHRALEISDDGAGMTRDELVNGFLRLASDLKVRSPRSPRFNRQRAGRKGIGRFAAQRLGARLVLTTKAKRSAGLRLTVDWNKFVSGKQLGDVSVLLEQVAVREPGTTVRIEDLRDAWSDSQIKRCWRSVVALQQPFPVAPVSKGPSSDPGFSVEFVRESGAGAESPVANLKTEVLDHLHGLVELRVDGQGRAEWRLTKNKFGETQNWTSIHHGTRRGAEVPRYGHLKDVYMKAYYFILDATLMPPMVYTRLRDVLSTEGGIRLYRNGFRVVPYGDPHDDWLQLDEAYAKRSKLAPFANRNFFGVIEINDPEGVDFEEHTSREGLIETDAFLELRELASSVLITAATRIATDRGKKTHAGSRKSGPKPAVTAELPELRSALEAIRGAVGSSGSGPADLEMVKSRVDEAERALAERIRLLQVAERSVADESAMLRLMATLGMVSAEFNHETGMTFDAFRSDFESVFALAESSVDDDLSLEQVGRARSMFERLDALTAYLNSLATARSKRDLTPQSMSKVVEDFGRGIRQQANSQGIQLETITPPYDPLFTRPIHGAELASVLLNLYTNSVKAMVRSGKDRRVRVSAWRSDDRARIQLRFSDTGDGIAEKDRDKVFEAFYTSSNAPPGGASEVSHAVGTGLGLWIVRQIADSARGEVGVVDSESGYATTIEFEIPAEELQE